MGFGGDAFRANLAHFRSGITPRRRPPYVTLMDECPQGGGHVPVPKQGGGGRVCAKCGKDC